MMKHKWMVWKVKRDFSLPLKRRLRSKKARNISLFSCCGGKNEMVFDWNVTLNPYRMTLVLTQLLV